MLCNSSNAVVATKPVQLIRGQGLLSQTITLTTTVSECKASLHKHQRTDRLAYLAEGPGGCRKWLSACTCAFSRKKTKSLQADRLLVYQNTYSLALCLAPNLLDEGLESGPTLLARAAFPEETHRPV